MDKVYSARFGHLAIAIMQYSAIKNIRHHFLSTKPIHHLTLRVRFKRDQKYSLLQRPMLDNGKDVTSHILSGPKR